MRMRFYYPFLCPSLNSFIALSIYLFIAVSPKISANSDKSTPSISPKAASMSGSKTANCDFFCSCFGLKIDKLFYSLILIYLLIYFSFLLTRYMRYIIFNFWLWSCLFFQIFKQWITIEFSRWFLVRLIQLSVTLIKWLPQMPWQKIQISSQKYFFHMKSRTAQILEIRLTKHTCR